MTALYSLVIKAVCGGRKQLLIVSLVDISTVSEVTVNTVNDIQLTVLLNINQCPDVNVNVTYTSN